MGGMLCDCGLPRRYIKEWMSWSHRNEKGNSNCSVMRMQSKAMRITNRYDTIQGGSVWVSFHQSRIQRTGFLHDYNWRLQTLSLQL